MFHGEYIKVLSIFIFLSLSSCIYSADQKKYELGLWSKEDNDNYSELKKAIFAKMGKSFIRSFYQKYPNPDADGNDVIDLAFYIDSISQWEHSKKHPQAKATIGNKEVLLNGQLRV